MSRLSSNPRKVDPVISNILADMPTATTSSGARLSPEQIDLNETFIKREKRRRKITSQEIKKMRANLPVYTRNEIRMFKLPCHEAVSLQLMEDGYESAASYIQQLFQLNDRLRLEAGPHSFIRTCPLLKKSDKELKKLGEALVDAENAHREQNYGKENEILLETSIDFAFNYTHWFWLAQELILQCIYIAQTFGLSKKYEASCRYVYGKILCENVKDYDRAESELVITRELSKGQCWNIKSLLPNEPNSADPLYMHANYLLHFCYMKRAKTYIKIDLNKALENALLAKHRAAEACFHHGETEALYLKGQIELNLNRSSLAVKTFTKAFHIQAKLNSAKGMCEARVELTKAHLMNGNLVQTTQTLEALKAMAEENDFEYYLAQAYRYLGEYYLACGQANKATPLLSEALHVFYTNGYILQADQVRNLAALSSGQESMPYYINLIQKTDKRSADWFENLMKLVKWKDSRASFFTPDEHLLNLEELYKTWGLCSDEELRNSQNVSMEVRREDEEEIDSLELPE